MPVSIEEMRRIEKKAEETGISVQIMMENAGANAARIVDEHAGLKGKTVLVFCCTGNNGGDVFVFARHALIYGAEVHVWLIKKPEFIKTEVAKRNFDILDSLKQAGSNISFYFDNVPEMEPDIAVDALLGIGIEGTVSEEYANAIKKFNAMKTYRVSLDCPSGIDADTGRAMGTAAVPDMTITFHSIKKGMSLYSCGEIVLASIGIPKA